MTDWTIDQAAADAIVRNEAQFRTMRDTKTVVAGIAMGQARWRDHLEGTLSLGGVPIEARALSAAMSSRLPLRMDPLNGIAATFSNCRMDAVTHALCRHAGIDPLRLAVTGAIARMRATCGGMTVELEPDVEAAEDGSRGVSSTFGLSADVSWQGGRLVIRRTKLAPSVLMGLSGTTLTQVLDHPWEGWSRIRVKRARVRGNTTIITTDAQDRVAIAA